MSLWLQSAPLFLGYQWMRQIPSWGFYTTVDYMNFTRLELLLPNWFYASWSTSISLETYLGMSLLKVSLCQVVFVPNTHFICHSNYLLQKRARGIEEISKQLLIKSFSFSLWICKVLSICFFFAWYPGSVHY